MPGLDSCDDDDSTKDSDGDSCSGWYKEHPEACGLHDTNSFNASRQCCACGGGLYASFIDTTEDDLDFSQ